MDETKILFHFLRIKNFSLPAGLPQTGRHSRELIRLHPRSRGANAGVLEVSMDARASPPPAGNRLPERESVSYQLGFTPGHGEPIR